MVWVVLRNRNAPNMVISITYGTVTLLVFVPPSLKSIEIDSVRLEEVDWPCLDLDKSVLLINIA